RKGQDLSRDRIGPLGRRPSSSPTLCPRAGAVGCERMASAVSRGEASAAPLRGELRYGFELARLLADRDFLRPVRRRDEPPALLVPGFMAGDRSLSVL